MNMLKAFFRFIFSKTFLSVLLVVGLGLAVWFGGPFLGIGESKPLEAASTRVVVLLFGLSLALFWLLHWPVSIVGVMAVCLLIWYGSPLVRIGEAQPFAPEWVRILLVCVFGGCFAVFLLYRFWKTLQANDALLQKLLHPRFGKQESAASEQIQELQSIVQRAMNHLRTLRPMVNGFARVMQGKRYVYELPWYMILGAPGAGKTTAILNSGLTFPLAEQLGATSLAGVSGTRNCVWWFTNEAVLIDTAGRYTTHETNLTVDAAEWQGFLRLLRKHRPRAPINGAILTVSVEDLTNRSRAELIQLAASLRERFMDLQEALGIRFPVYVMVTKMDLLKGFEEYFHYLRHEGRNQVWGFTVPYAEKENTKLSKADVREVYSGELTLLLQRLEQGLDTRLREEYSLERRRNLYCLPAELSSLFEPLLQLVELIFFESRYSGSQVQPIMRGIYFTSAVQGEQPVTLGRTSLLQRLKGFVQGGQDLFEPTFTAKDAAQHPTATRSYFLHDMLRRVIFPEAFLVKPNTRWEWRFLLVRSLGHLFVLVAAAGLIGALFTSKANNAKMLREVSGREKVVEDNLALVQQGQRTELVPYVLHQACSLVDDDTWDVESPPLSYRLGLYSLGDVTVASQLTCSKLQERFLIPQATARLEQQLMAAVNAFKASASMENSMHLYDVLRVYLIFYDKTRYQPATIVTWFMADLKKQQSGHFLAAHDMLPVHLERVLRRTEGFDRSRPFNGELVNQARMQLKNESREERLYSRAKAALYAEAPEDFIPARHMDEAGGGVLFRASGRSMTEGLSGLFTYEGYHQTFEPKIMLFLPEALREDTWIMGEAEQGDRAQRGVMYMQQVAGKVRQLYLKEYALRWQSFIQDIRVTVGALPESNLETLRLLGSSNSPLDQLAKAVVRETALSAKKPDVAGQLTEVATKKIKAKTRTTGLNFGPMDEVSLVDSKFAALRKVVTGVANPDSARAPALPDSAELSALRAMLSAYAAHMQEVIKASALNALPAPNTAAEKLAEKAAQMPPFFSTVVSALATSSTAQEGASRTRTMTQLAEAQVFLPCRKQLESRYPFNPKGRDADPADVVALLAPGGTFDVFFQKNLESLVNTESTPWTYRSATQEGMDLAFFEKVAALREILFVDGDAKKVHMDYKIAVVDMDSRIERLEVRIGEQVLHYEHGPSYPLAVEWQGDLKAVAEMNLRPRSLGAMPLKESGPWALLRLLRQGRVERTMHPGHFWLEFDFDPFTATLEVTAAGENLVTTKLLESFSCPKVSP